MRAISQERFGGPEVLHVVDIEPPSTAPGEVLVRVHAAGVNPADWKRRAGLLRRFGEPPFTVGLDFAGTADGTAVFGVVLPPRGTYAEFVAVPRVQLAPAPEGLDPVHAAALPTTALTAWQALVRGAGLQRGQRVLVHAAAGGIGHLAVQIAKARGAYVIGTARRDKHDFVAGLGADEVVDYTAVDFTKAVQDVDVVLDPIAGDYGPRSLEVLSPDGILVDVRGTGPDRTAVRALAQERGLRYTQFGFTPSGEDLRKIAAMVESGTLGVAVDRVLPLEEAARAHELSESGPVRGKIVLAVA
ncbi:NADP-dependent oxidoreductase [Dactylosporangium sp. CA-139066]|uniref:NADP-dependent oxidoreductase n=1 Tax=Dactylosporangium sp. CA-139066 TaxID=3239930 RepID=UPI003D8DA6C6